MSGGELSGAGTSGAGAEGVPGPGGRPSPGAGGVGTGVGTGAGTGPGTGTGSGAGTGAVLDTGAAGSRPLRRFFGTVRLDPDRAGRDMGTVAEEVLQHLTTLPGAEVEVSVEISAKVPAGLKDPLILYMKNIL